VLKLTGKQVEALINRVVVRAEGELRRFDKQDKRLFLALLRARTRRYFWPENDPSYERTRIAEQQRLIESLTDALRLLREAPSPGPGMTSMPALLVHTYFDQAALATESMERFLMTLRTLMQRFEAKPLRGRRPKNTERAALVGVGQDFFACFKALPTTTPGAPFANVCCIFLSEVTGTEVSDPSRQIAFAVKAVRRKPIDLHTIVSHRELD
jgi:hypothetical protein